MTVKLKDGTVIAIEFSNYFLSRVQKLLGYGLQGTITAVLGRFEDGMVYGGLLDDMDVRAAVIAAGIDAHNLSTSRELTQTSMVEGYTIMAGIDNSVTNPVWSEMYVEIAKSLAPESKKKAVKGEDKASQ